MSAFSNNIGLQIEEFLRSTLEKTKPSWIVTVERKGTALFRTLVESTAGPGSAWKGWERVLSSDALTRVPEACLQDGCILLLDDGIHHGSRLQMALDILTQEKKVPRERIKVAAFSVHEESSFGQVDFRWFGQLGRDCCGEVRASVIRFFQQRGSLLLDTEHIEVPVDLNCGRLEFFDALCRAGIGVEHMSSGGCVNLTIYKPLLLDEPQFLARLPSGTTVRDVVRKIRVVERGKNRYAIIPIFYPSTPANTSADSLSTLDDCLKQLASDPETNFHLVGIFAAIHLFHTVFACLRELIREGKVRVRVPRPGDAGDSLGHLKALFPTIDLEGLHKVVEGSVEAGRAWKARRGELRKSCRIEAANGTKYAAELNRLHWLTLKEVLRLSEDLPAGYGPTLSELMRIVRTSTSDEEERRVAEALLSAAHDRAIDDADLVTDVKEMPFSDGQLRKVRVFKLDGELVLSDVRKAAALWRSPSPPPPVGG